MIDKLSGYCNEDLFTEVKPNGSFGCVPPQRIGAPESKCSAYCAGRKRVNNKPKQAFACRSACDILNRTVSVAVLLNLSDGLILGVDSAVTIFDASGISKVFEDSEKIFQLGDLRVGIATYGVAGLEGRTIGSFIREFETQPNNNGLRSLTIEQITEEARKFFSAVYVRCVESIFGIPFDQVPPDKKGALGLIVGGFSPGAFLSEAWQVMIPWNDQPGSATQIYGPGEFGSAWFATSDPIQRYIKGIDPNLLVQIHELIKKFLGRDMNQAEIDELTALCNQYQCATKIDGMPISAGLDYVRFLVNLVINHYRYAATHPIVGGRAKLGVVTYKQESFQLLD